MSGPAHFDTYEVNTPTSHDRVEIYGNAKSGSSTGSLPVDLSYLSFAYWAHTNKDNNETRQSFLLFGEPTASNDMPVSGTARYKTSVFANVLGVSGASNNVGVLQKLNGTASFRINFETGRVRTDLDLERAVDGLDYGYYTGVGKVYAANQFNGKFSSDRPDFNSGAFAGSFYGPAAQEMGYGFYIHLHDDGLGGASVRPRVDQWIEGAVVGTK